MTSERRTTKYIPGVPPVHAGSLSDQVYGCDVAVENQAIEYDGDAINSLTAAIQDQVSVRSPITRILCRQGSRVYGWHPAVNLQTHQVSVFHSDP